MPLKTLHVQILKLGARMWPDKNGLRRLMTKLWLVDWCTWALICRTLGNASSIVSTIRCLSVLGAMLCLIGFVF